MKKRNQIINNPKKEKPSYAKMYKEQIKKESELNSNKSHMSNNKIEHDNNHNNHNKNENQNNKEEKQEKQEIKHNGGGINFDKLSDWDNIVYPGDKEIKQIINNAENNNNQPQQQNNENNNLNIVDNNINNNNLKSTAKFGLNRMDFQNNNNIIHQIQEVEKLKQKI